MIKCHFLNVSQGILNYYLFYDYKEVNNSWLFLKKEKWQVLATRITSKDLSFYKITGYVYVILQTKK